MSRFLIKITGFIAVLLVLGIGYDYYVSHQLKQSPAAQGEYEVWTDIYDGNIDADIAIYGSSRAWVHFDPSILSAIWGKAVYNFGVDGYDFWMQYLRHKAYIKHNNLPKVIIISLDVFSFELKRGMYNDNQFLPYMLFNKDMYEYTSVYGGYEFLDYWVPVLRYHAKPEVVKYAFDVWKMPDTNYRKLGYKEQYQEWNIELENKRKQESPITTTVDSMVYNTFITFVEQCQQDNIHLILVYSPEEVTGRDYISNRAEMLQMYEQTAHKYQIPFLDYSDDPICSDKGLFYNATHLNYKGSSRFSNEFGNRVDSLIKSYF